MADQERLSIFMKILFLFFVMFSITVYLFGNDEIRIFETNKAISESPAFAPATVYEVVTIKRKKRLSQDAKESYYIRYNYFVNDVQYEVKTTMTDQEGLKAYLSDPEPQVAYSATKPEIATLKRYYDIRRKDETLFQVLLVVGFLALIISLPTSLIIGWRLGWLKRKPAHR